LITVTTDSVLPRKCEYVTIAIRSTM